MVVENRYEGVVVSDDSEVWEACKKELALGDGPGHSQELQLNDGIPRLCAGEESGAGLNESPIVAVLLLQYETEALAAGIRAEACWFVEVEEREGGGRGEGLFGGGECMVYVR